MDLPSYLLGKNAGGGGGGTTSTDLYVLDHTQYTSRTINLKGLKKGIYCWDDAGYFFTFKWDEETDQHPMLSNIPTVNGCFIVLMDINEDIANNTTIVLCGETGTTETGATYVNTKNNLKIKKINNQYKLNPGFTPISRDVSAEDMAQTIYGVKTFETLPESRIQPTTNNQLTNKSYVDDNISNHAPAVVTLTQTEYDNLGTYADNTEYHIIEE